MNTLPMPTSTIVMPVNARSTLFRTFFILYSRSRPGNATGPGSPCDKRCPGAAGSGLCDGDTCCGGARAYSVFIVGDIDSVKEILSRAYDALEANNYARLKVLSENAGDVWLGDYTHKRNTRLASHYASCVTANAEYCWKKCAAQTRCQGSTWSDAERTVGTTHNCFLFSPGGREFQQDGWTSYLKGRERNFVNAMGKRLIGHYQVSKTSSALECRRLCLSQRGRCGASTFTSGDISRWSHDHRCFLLEYASYRTTRQDSWYSFEFSRPPLRISTTATSLNEEGEETGKKKCTMAESYSCEASTELELRATVNLEAKTMERQLVHGSGRSLKPLGRYDFEKDNSGTDLPAVITKVVRISESGARRWHTEAGADISYTVGSRFSTTAGFSAMGVSASATAEISTQLSVGGFFTAGYEETTTHTVEDEIRVEYTVPPRAKLQINFFRETYPLQVKWRAELVGSGMVQVSYLDQEWHFYLSEVLSQQQRTVYSFGTIDMGDREKIVSIAKIMDDQGALLDRKREVIKVIS